MVGHDPAYNCNDLLADSLRSVLNQDLGPNQMQIEVVDDHSAVSPEEIVRAIGGDRVGFFRQPRNLGHIANFQTCIERAQGEIVHLPHGDDLVGARFYQALQAGFDFDPAIGAAFCRSIYIDAEGRQLGMTDQEQPYAGLLADAAVYLAREQRIMTPSIAVRRKVYEELGGFDRRLKCAEDWEMWVRIAASYLIWYEPRPLAFYRIHAASNTGRHTRSAEDMA